jgi:mono/diheme cytochrome c family protein
MSSPIRAEEAGMDIRAKRMGALAAILLATALGVVIGQAAKVSAQDAPSGDAGNGKRVYLADGCFQCHGRSGQGGAFNYPAPAIAQVEMPAESFVAFLREAPRDMPTYSTAVLSDKDANDIYAFLRSLPGRKPVQDFPLLNQ